MGPRWEAPSFKVDFMIVGTMRGGTTALNHFLSQHPDVCTASPKETHFFEGDENFTTGTSTYQRYHRHFSHHAGEKLVGEATPSYMYVPRVPERLQAYNASLKLVFLLRNPAERAYSHYRLRVADNRERRSFEEALQWESAHLANAGDDFYQRSWRASSSYVSRGFYARQIKNVLRCFPLEQLLFLRTEDLQRRYHETLTKVHVFLGLNDHFFPIWRRINVRCYPPMARGSRERLRELYEREIDELEQLLGWDLSAWSS